MLFIEYIDNVCFIVKIVTFFDWVITIMVKILMYVLFFDHKSGKYCKTYLINLPGQLFNSSKLVWYNLFNCIFLSEWQNIIGQLSKTALKRSSVPFSFHFFSQTIFTLAFSFLTFLPQGLYFHLSHHSPSPLPLFSLHCLTPYPFNSMI